MKIAIRAGHNELAPGFSLMLDEIEESRKIKDAAIKYLIENDFEVLDVTPEEMNVYNDAHIPVEIANKLGADLFIAIHFNRNKAPIGETNYTKYEGPLGSIAWVYQMNSVAADVGAKILNTLTSVGFTNRGIKTKRFYDLKGTTMPSVRIEICFVEATDDVSIYNAVGADKIGFLLVEGIKDYYNQN